LPFEFAIPIRALRLRSTLPKTVGPGFPHGAVPALPLLEELIKSLAHICTISFISASRLADLWRCVVGNARPSPPVGILTPSWTITSAAAINTVIYCRSS